MHLILRALSCSLLGLVVAACGGGGDDTPQTDSIEIVAVTPPTARVDQASEFTVTFRYSLASSQSGIVNIGFFVDSINQRLTGQSVVVARGAGTGTLTATVIPSTYTTTSDFAVGVLLSENPHAQSWTPLARSKQSIPLSP
jgi:hypothetical protein